MKRNLNIYLLTALLFILSSCSIAGSWVYERADSYLAEYFKEYANFSDEQEDEIDKVTKDYLDWFTENELPVIRSILVNLMDINNNNAKYLIKDAYLNGEGLFERSNKYFENSFVEFSKNLTDLQIKEIKIHFDEIQSERKKEREKEREKVKSYSDRIAKDFVSAFKRINIRLTGAQKDFIRLNTKELEDTTNDWSYFQKKWVEELMIILNQRDDPDFVITITEHLRSFEDFDKEFQLKRENNIEIGLKIISELFSNASEKQINSFKRRIETFIASIDRILANRSLD